MRSNFDIQAESDADTLLTNGLIETLVSLELPEGAWNMSAMVYFGEKPTYAIASISSRNSEIDDTFAREADGLIVPIPSPAPPDPYKKRGPTTVYLTVKANFAANRGTARGILKAHRAISL
jgi:hypothetical protein